MNTDINNQQNTTTTKPQTTVPLTKRILKSIDLFSFLPVPKAKPVSSKRSLIGSLLMICAFISYFLFGFITFVTNNAPRVNIYQNVMPDMNITMPEIAFAFFLGETFTETINNQSIFTFTYQQVTKYKNITIADEKLNIPLRDCHPTWLPTQTQPLLCPIEPGIMSGALYQTDKFLYPRIVVNYCKESATVTCVNQTQIAQTAAGGRIFLFIQDLGPDFDMTTGQPVEHIPYNVFQMYLIPGMYPRAQFYFQRAEYKIYPDYFRRFQLDVREYLEFESTSNWMTNVSIYNSRNAYQIFFRMNLTQQTGSLLYATILDMIALWGAFWGVLFSAFGAYFLAYNQSQFYKENRDWEDFGMKVGVNKPRDSIDGEYYKDKSVIDTQRSELSMPVKNSGINNDTMVFEMGEL